MFWNKLPDIWKIIISWISKLIPGLNPKNHKIPGLGICLQSLGLQIGLQSLVTTKVKNAQFSWVINPLHKGISIWCSYVYN